METFDRKEDKSVEERFHARSGRVWAGFFLIILGGLLMASQMGVDFPYWFFRWPMILIGVGLFVGAQHSFRPGGWLIPIFIGALFLIDEVVPDVDLKAFIWPAIIITIGLVMIFRPRKHRRSKVDRWNSLGPQSVSENADEDVIDSVVIFGGTKKNIISKNFKGGEVLAIFGGNELNLMQADFTGTITLEMTQIFGGAKLIIPPNWKIQSEVVSIFGSVEDKRPLTTEPSEQSKVLKLVGTNIFGGIDLKSH